MSSTERESKTDEFFMNRCIGLALRGRGQVSPNPMVGALIVLDGRIVGEGWHAQYGKAHAEVNAVEDLRKRFGDQAKFMLTHSCIYVTLEPCAHQGKTPPCANFIVVSGIPKVVIGNLDPSDKVNGKGISCLKQAGVQVKVGVLDESCRLMNARFFTRTLKSRPYVILKWAASADGFIAPFSSQKYQLSSAISEQLSHRWRTEEDSILVGKNTALLDDPRLTARAFPGRNPLRVIIDWNLDLPNHYAIFNGEAQTIIFNGLISEVKNQVTYIKLDSRAYAVEFILYQLYLLDCSSVIVEGGLGMLEQFIKRNLWDEARVFKTTETLEKGVEEPILHRTPKRTFESGRDRLYIYLNNV